MNNFFDQIETDITDAVRRRAHMPWYKRLRVFARPKGLVFALAALVIAAPALGAVTNWYGFGASDHFPKNSPTMNSGRAFAATSNLLSLRVRDPQSGPPWGLRLVRTTRGDTCVQYGRVEDDQIGSLGIDHAWNDDRQFHPFPDTAEGWNCATDDGDGHAFFNVSLGGIPGSANPSSNAHGPQGKDCAVQPYGSLPTCPAGSSRVVFFGLLGPDATSISYRAPDGTIRVAKTAGSDGAYLLVFKFDTHTCYMYSHSPGRSFSPCTAQGFAGASPGPWAVTAIHYRNGNTCSLVPSAGEERLLTTLSHEFRARIQQLGPNLRKTPRATLIRLIDPILAAHHLTFKQYIVLTRKSNGIDACPAVGYVPPELPHLTAADVASTITAKRLPNRFDQTNVQISFIARQPVTRSSSWYEIANSGPPACEDNSSGQIGFGNVRAGQRLKTTVSTTLGCRGVVRGVVGYMQNSGPINAEFGGGGRPGQDGSIIVGRFSFRVR